MDAPPSVTSTEPSSRKSTFVNTRMLRESERHACIVILSRRLWFYWRPLAVVWMELVRGESLVKLLRSASVGRWLPMRLVASSLCLKRTQKQREERTKMRKTNDLTLKNDLHKYKK